ncbi:MAG: hypothetical protein L7U72_12055 [Rubripirellula sp.]|nr:hypothetical protein [Rubripirellula sp.]
MNSLRGMKIAFVAVMMFGTLVLSSAEAGRLGKKAKACCEEAAAEECATCTEAEGECCEGKQRVGLIKRMRAAKACCAEEAAACCSEGEEAAAEECATCTEAEGECCEGKKRCGLMKRMRAAKECCAEETACCSEGEEAATAAPAEECASCSEAAGECCEGKKRCGLMKRLRASKECCQEEAKACCSEA